MKVIDSTEIVTGASGANTRPNYLIEDVETGLRNLSSIVDLAAQLYFDNAKSGSDERVGSLLWLARDLVVGVEEAYLSGSESA